MSAHLSSRFAGFLLVLGLPAFEDEEEKYDIFYWH
jgi:hypothetical protein